MKRSLYLILIVSGVSYGQPNEFATYSNGLIYSEATMSKLARIVDSLNVKFRSCDLAHPYFSWPQGEGHFVKLSKASKKLVDEGITFEEFSRRFPGEVVKRAMWVVKLRYTDYNGNKHIEYSGLPYGWNSEPSIQVIDHKDFDKLSGWVVNEEGTEAFYLPGLKRIELPAAYARLVQYVDCMIDTTATIYSPRTNRIDRPEEDNSKGKQFVKWAGEFPGEPDYPDFQKIEREKMQAVFEMASKKHDQWDSLRLIDLDRRMKAEVFWSGLLAEARDEAINNGNSNDELEFYIGRYLSREDALKLKRQRRVVGRCSQDQSPRYHAMRICQLAAETTHWDIFLRSHLDIMNDRFDRMSDGSYAWRGRKTYLKELEELEIPATDLLLGTSLRVENVSDKHYLGSVGRVGRALTETTDKDKLEMQMITMLKDDQLDLYNRTMLLYLFDNYNYNLEDGNRKTADTKLLRETAATMPAPIREIWKKKDR